MASLAKDIWAVYANRGPVGKMVVATAMAISSASTAFMGVVVYDVATNPDLRAPAPQSAPAPEPAEETPINRLPHPREILPPPAKTLEA